MNLRLRENFEISFHELRTWTNSLETLSLKGTKAKKITILAYDYVDTSPSWKYLWWSTSESQEWPKNVIPRHICEKNITLFIFRKCQCSGTNSFVGGKLYNICFSQNSFKRPLSSFSSCWVDTVISYFLLLFWWSGCWLYAWLHQMWQRHKNVDMKKIHSQSFLKKS